MPRRLFARLLLQSALALLALLVGAGLALDRFLEHNEVRRIEDLVARFALLLGEDVARSAPGSLQGLVDRMGRVSRVRFTVVDRGGRVLADSDRDPAAMENHASHPEVAEALAGRQGRSVRRSATLGIEMLYVAVPGPPVVRAAVPMAEVRGVLSQVRLRIALAAFPAALLALALAYVLSRSLARRIEGMIRFSSSLARGEFEGALPVRGDDELSDLERGLLALRDEIRRRVETLGREREALAALVEGLPHAVLVLDADRHLALANSLARTLLRLKDRQVGGHPAAAETVRNPAVLGALDRLAAGAQPEPLVIEWPDPPLHLEVTVRTLPDPIGRPGALVVLRDVSRQVHLERVRTDFVANLSHELRTPLTAIRGAAETLLGAARGDPAAAEKFLETIRRNALRLESVLGDVSELARLEAGAAPPQVCAFDAGLVAVQVVDLFSAEARRAGLELAVRTPDEPLAVRSDPHKVESILINLVQNGVRYTPSGGRVEVFAEAAEGGVVYRVEDTGIGIPPRELPRVTERFYRVDPGRSRSTGGTGLGLAIVKHLVDLLGGTLEIRSEPGRGTAVRVFLPSLTPT